MRFLLPMIAACAVSQYRPVTVTAPPDALARAVRVLSDRGESIETKDESAGLVVTKWNESESMGDLHQYRWQVTISDGTLTVASQCRWKEKNPGMFGPGDWIDCTKSQSNDRAQGANAIAAAIGTQ